MNTALADIAGVTDSPPPKVDRIKFPVAANVLSLQARRDLRRSTITTESLQVELPRDTRRLQLLLDLATDAVSNRELGGLVNAIMKRVKSALDSDGICILLKNQNGELDLYSRDFRSKGSSLKERAVRPLAGSIASYVLSSGKLWAGTREQACANFKSEPLLREQFSTGCMFITRTCRRAITASV